MTCEHLRPIMDLAEKVGAAETDRGRFWSGAAGEWVYYRCRFDKDRVAALVKPPAFVHWHEHLGTHDGSEAGFVCDLCQTGVMGLHPRDDRQALTVPDPET